MKRIAILGSTRGTILPDLIKGILKHAQIEIVLSDKKESGILEKARRHQLPVQFIDSQGLSRTEFDKKISSILQQNDIDFVILIGYMRILSNEFVQTWKNKIINVHPSLLPSFAGLMNKQVHEAVLKSGVSETGCTVHYVTEEIDAGPILVQRKCSVHPEDTVETLKARVQLLECETLIETIKKLNL